MRSLSQLGASYLLHACAEGPALAGNPAATAVAALGQWGLLLGSSSSSSNGAESPTGDSRGGGGSDSSTEAALQAAVAALEAGSVQRCQQVVASARRELVGGLVTASVEGAAHVNPALVELQMLQGVSEAWELKWPSLPDLGSVGSPRRQRQRGSGGAAAGAAAAAAVGPAASVPMVDQTLLASLARLWRSREAAAGAGKRYELLAPLQGLRQQLMQLLGAPQQQAAALVEAAEAARKTGHYAQATSSLYKLRCLLQQQQQQQQANLVVAEAGGAAAQGAGGGGSTGLPGLPAWLRGMLGPDAGWRAEEAKLLWAQGQQDSAVHLVRELLHAMEGDDSDSDAAQQARLQCLTAKWLSHTRAESPASILGMMESAADAMDECEYMGHPTLQASGAAVVMDLLACCLPACQWLTSAACGGWQ